MPRIGVVRCTSKSATKTCCSFVYYVPDCCPDPALQSVASFLWSKQIEVVMPKACFRWIPVPNTAYHCQVRWEEMLMLSGTLHESSWWWYKVGHVMMNDDETWWNKNTSLRGKRELWHLAFHEKGFPIWPLAQMILQFKWLPHATLSLGWE